MYKMMDEKIIFRVFFYLFVVICFIYFKINKILLEYFEFYLLMIKNSEVEK